MGKKQAARRDEELIGHGRRVVETVRQAVRSTGSGRMSNVLAAWEKHRVVYRLHPGLMGALQETDLDVIPPKDSCRYLPHPAVVVLFPERLRVWDDVDLLWYVMDGCMFAPLRFTEMKKFTEQASFFGSEVSEVGTADIMSAVYAGFRENSNATAFVTSSVVFDTETRTVQGLLDKEREAFKDVSTSGFHGRVGPSLKGDLMVFLWKLLLYLSSSEPDVRPVGGGGRDGRYVDRSGRVWSVWDFGWRVGPALVSASGAVGGSGMSGRSVRPHVRKGHWHTYWYGPLTGERVRRLRWVAPMVVAADGTGQVDVTVRPVG